MRLAAPSLLFLLLAAAPARAADPIVPPDSKLELLYTREIEDATGLTEGPAVAPDGSIYFTDLVFGTNPGRIMRFDPKTKKTAVFVADSGKANGLSFDAKGRLLACEGSDHGGRRIAAYDVATGKSVTLADRYLGKRFNAPNDMTIDSRGRIYFSDPRYLGDEPRELEHRAVYRVDVGGQVVEVTHEVEKPNGVALSPDEKTLYLADHNNGTDKIDPNGPPPAKKGAMKIYAFPLGPDGLVNGPRKTLVDFGAQDGCDGMCVDSAGRIYLTARSKNRPGVKIIDSTGQEVGFIPTGAPNQDDVKSPVGLPSNVTFGAGEESNVLYITVDKKLYRIRLNAQGLK